MKKEVAEFIKNFKKRVTVVRYSRTNSDYDCFEKKEVFHFTELDFVNALEKESIYTEQTKYKAIGVVKYDVITSIEELPPEVLLGRKRIDLENLYFSFNDKPGKENVTIILPYKIEYIDHFNNELVECEIELKKESNFII